MKKALNHPLPERKYQHDELGRVTMETETDGETVTSVKYTWHGPPILAITDDLLETGEYPWIYRIMALRPEPSIDDVYQLGDQYRVKLIDRDEHLAVWYAERLPDVD